MGLYDCGMNPGAAIFVSYSRKDYYFTESLVLHLEHRGVPVWFDAKDLKPGSFWDRDVEEAIDSASCVILVTSPDSIRRPYVRMEWERAKKQNKRIVLALFRSVRLPSDLANCEVIDFRGAFSGGVARLAETLSQPHALAEKVNAAFSFSLPPWVYAVSLTLLIPLVTYLLLGQWSEPGINIALQTLLVCLCLALFGWFFFLAFLRRRMGMTHLLINLSFIAACILYPLLRYSFGGRAALDPQANALDLALLGNLRFMEISAVFSLAGLAIFMVKRPDDLLRWTPTGAAWNWYRQASIARLSVKYAQSSAKQVKTYHLWNDAADAGTAQRFRQEMQAVGASEAPATEAETSILLLTSRTRNEWLADREPALPANALLVVASPIGLPPQFEHLWRREWMDFRQWDARKLKDEQEAPEVPEAVTRFRYPSDVRLAHRAMCCLAAMAWVTVYVIDPATSQEPVAILAAAVSVFTFIVAHRFLNRTISDRGFRSGWRIALAATGVLQLWALAASLARHESRWGLWLGVLLLVAVPWLFVRLQNRLSFWFPSPVAARAGKEARLRPGRNWQTLLWVVLWVAFWFVLAGVLTSPDQIPAAVVAPGGFGFSFESMSSSLSSAGLTSCAAASHCRCSAISCSLTAFTNCCTASRWPAIAAARTSSNFTFRSRRASPVLT